MSYDYALSAMANVRNASLDSLNFCTGTGAGAPVSCPSTRDRWSSRLGAPACSPDNPRSHLPHLLVAVRRTWSPSRTCTRVGYRPDQCIHIYRSLCNPRQSFLPCTIRHRSRSPTWWNRPHCHAGIAWWSTKYCLLLFVEYWKISQKRILL